MTSLAAVASQQNAASAAATASAAGASVGGAGASSAASTQPANALSSLSGNFNTFLNLLMTQLQNQDPTSPVDTNQFTQELVQFSQVEQQINTNSSLNTLIQLTQTGQVLQGSSLIGKRVDVASTQVPLQSGVAPAITFTAPVAGTASVTVANAAGVVVAQPQISASQGSNSWTWDGTGANGSTQPDGLYTFTVNGPAATGGSQSLPFSVVGTATGVTRNNGTIDLQMGGLTADFGHVQSVGN